MYQLNIKKYAKDGHGGNKLLIDLLTQDPQKYKKFQYSILRTLPRTLTAAEVVAVEMLYKKSLVAEPLG